VTTWNILAPVWADPSYYPARSEQHLDRTKRRQSIAAHLKSFESDVFLLQEGAAKIASMHVPNMRGFS
jgi:mRNA deadenylase 3'-5' endonuclease subunit Ccr4